MKSKFGRSAGAVLQHARISAGAPLETRAGGGGPAAAPDSVEQHGLEALQVGGHDVVPRQLPAHQLPHHDPERVDVDRAVVLGLLEQLGRAPVGGPDVARQHQLVGGERGRGPGGLGGEGGGPAAVGGDGLGGAGGGDGLGEPALPKVADLRSEG